MYKAFLTLVLLTALACAPSVARGGAIHATVRLDGPASEPKKLQITIDQYVCGQEKVADDLIVSPKQGVRNVVGWLENPPPDAQWKSPLKPAEMDQEACVFVPRVVLVPSGGTLHFLNSDRLLHNIHGRPKANPPFNRTQPKGRTIAMTFPNPEIIQVDCDLHSWMRAWIIIAPHRFYAISDAEGNLRFDDVPPGRYTLKLWHEVLGTTTRDVVVDEPGPSRVNVDMRRR
jgi:plastocyanin